MNEQVCRKQLRFTLQHQSNIHCNYLLISAETNLKWFDNILCHVYKWIRNVSWAANQYIRVISEGSCDTEDWSNDAEISDLNTEIYYIWTFITIENSYFNL